MGRGGWALVLCIGFGGGCRFDASGAGETEVTGSGTSSGGSATSTGHGLDDTTGVRPTPPEPDTTSTTSGGSSSSSTGEGSSSGQAESSSTGDGLAEVEYCVAPGLPIPDNDATGVSASVDVNQPGGGFVVDLAVVIQATHGYVGDLRFDLRKDQAEVIVIDQPGGGDCDGHDIDVILHDGAAAPVGSSCVGAGAGMPGLSGELQPELPLLPVFGGLQMLGTWRLRATDTQDVDVGTLDAWCLRITYQ